MKVELLLPKTVDVNLKVGWNFCGCRKSSTLFKVNWAKWIGPSALIQLNKGYVFHTEIHNKTKWNSLLVVGMPWKVKVWVFGGWMFVSYSDSALRVFHSRPFAFGMSPVNHTSWSNIRLNRLKEEMSALREKQYHLVKNYFSYNRLLGKPTRHWRKREFFEVWERFGTECKIC